MFVNYSSSAVQQFLGLYSALLNASVTEYNYPDVDPNLRPINVPNSELLDEYDFIVVGSGSAGSPLANRLSEIEEWSVLLLEAGGDETAVTDTPMMDYNIRLTEANWNYSTVPQERVCKATNNICSVARGRIIGGSSTLNDFVYVRGNRLDYDGWATAGNPGWSYHDVLPYFIRLENITDPSVINSPFHGKRGPITIGRSPYLTKMVPHYLAAFEELGSPERDVDGESQIGHMITRGPIIDGYRCSTARGYLRPIRNRTNLHVAEHAFVEKINIDPASQTALGVTITRYGRQIKIRAKKEVILSAGAINSPQILMLSGIGPAEHLEALGIPLIENLKVGDNLQDHFAVVAPFTQPKNVNINFENLFLNLTNVLEFAAHGTGPLTSLAGAEVGGNLYNDNPPKVPGLPDTSVQFGSFIPTNFDEQAFYPLTYLFRPTSTGHIRLNDSNPRTPPLIDPKYLDTEFDRVETLKTARIAFNFGATKALQSIGASFAQKYVPMCQFPGEITDEFLTCIIEYYGLSNYHFCCSCKMGPSSDKSAVVDSRLRVHNVKRLRVVDASVMPSIVSANLNGPTIMIGERASDLIREDHGKPIGHVPPIPVL